jgi:hypothetical protein
MPELEVGVVVATALLVEATGAAVVVEAAAVVAGTAVVVGTAGAAEVEARVLSVAAGQT